MYIATTRGELFDLIAVYVGYAPNFTGYEFFDTQEHAELKLFRSIEAVFASDMEVQNKMRDAAESAFCAFKEGRIDEGFAGFRVMIGALMP